MKTAYKTIDCGWMQKRFLDAPISMKFEHTLSAMSPSIGENYHISKYQNATHRDTTCTITIGIRYRQVFFVLDDAFIKQSRLKTEESASLLLNNRIADIIRENKLILYAELMQWANKANFGEVR